MIYNAFIREKNRPFTPEHDMHTPFHERFSITMSFSARQHRPSELDNNLTYLEHGLPNLTLALQPKATDPNADSNDSNAPEHA